MTVGREGLRLATPMTTGQAEGAYKAPAPFCATVKFGDLFECRAAVKAKLALLEGLWATSPEAAGSRSQLQDTLCAIGAIAEPVARGEADAEMLKTVLPHPRQCRCSWGRLRAVLQPLDGLRWVWLDDQGDLCATCPPSSRLDGLARYFSGKWQGMRVEYGGQDLVVEGIGRRRKDSRRFLALVVSPEIYEVVAGLHPAATLLTRTHEVRARQHRALELSDGEARLVSQLAMAEPEPTEDAAFKRTLELLVAHRAAHPNQHPLDDKVLEVMGGLLDGWGEGFDDLVEVSKGLAEDEAGLAAA